MGRERRQFSDEFRAEAVQLVLSSGLPIARVARDLGINDGTLGNWVLRWKQDHPEVEEEPLTPSERAELARLRKEVTTLRMEREFLKKAAAFFAAEQTK